MTGIAAGLSALTGVAFGWWGAAAASLIAGLLAVWRPNRPVLVGACVVILIAALGAWRSTDARDATGFTGFESGGTALVVSAPVSTGQVQYFKAENIIDPDRGGSAPGSPVCATTGAAPIVRFGDHIVIIGDVVLARDVSVARRAALETRGCGASVFAVAHWVVGSTPSPGRAIAEFRSRIGSVLRKTTPGDAGVLLNGLVTGDDAGFSGQREKAFFNTGTTHLTAVSGANLALVVAILAVIGGGTIGRHQPIWQFLTIGGVWAYAVVSGAQAPAVRAAIVATAAIFAFRFGRRPDFPTLILLAAGAMALYEPGQMDSLGFRLSVASSLALAWVLPGLVKTSRASPVTSVVLATTAAQIATAPLLLPVFGALSLVSVPANIIAAPLVAIAMPLAFIAGLAGIVWLPLGEAVAAPAGIAATAMLTTIDFFSGQGSSASVGVPATGVVWVLAAAAVALLIAMSGKLPGAMRNHRAVRVFSTDASNPAGSGPSKGDGAENGYVSFLPPLAPRILAREDPADAFAADADDAVEHPASEEILHKPAEQRDCPQAISRKG